MIIIKATLTETRPPDIIRQGWREITRGAHRAVGVYWVENYLQKHFEPRAERMYGYPRRSRQYEERKERLRASGRPFTRGGAPIIGGKTQANVLTGYMRREMTRNVIIRGFPTRCTVILLGPAYLTTRFHKKRQPDKGKEITTVTRAENEVLSGILHDEVAKRIEAYRQTRVTRF